MKTPADLGWGDPRELGPADMVAADVGHGVTIRVRNTDAGVVFRELVRRLEAAGMPAINGPIPDDWGYAGRLKRWAQAAGQHPSSAPLTSWSDHAWGTAFDLNTARNPMLGHRPADQWEHTDMPRGTGVIAAQLGLEWGGSWDEPWDPQHFQLAMTPARTKRLADTIRAARGEEGFTMDADAKAAFREVDARLARIEAAVGAGERQDAVDQQTLVGKANGTGLRLDRVEDQVLAIADKVGADAPPKFQPAK